MNLQERAQVVALVWPDEKDVTRVLNRCALVNDVELGLPVPISPKEREAVEAEIKKRQTVAVP